MMLKRALILIALFGLLSGCQTAPPQPSSSITPTTSTVSPSPDPTTTLVQTDAPTRTSTVPPTQTSSPTLAPSATPAPTLAPGATQISPLDGMVLVYIPAGAFLMGSTQADVGADADEFPQHRVYLNAYWMDQTVVTNAMYAAFLNEMDNQTEGRTTWLDAGDEDALIYQRSDLWQPVQGFENHPAIEITWFGAQAYCHWAGRRLPTEAEWEKAARGPIPPLPQGAGPGVRGYPWGDEIDCDRAQYANCDGGLLPADSKPAGASPYGVLGLSGNTWEWVFDWYAADYYASSPEENPTGPAESQTRVLRGASWEYDWKHLRAANRRHNGPAVSMHDYGFRCVVEDLAPPTP